MAESYPDYLREVYLSEEEDIRFTVLSTAVSDTLPTDTFSQQYFTTDMENWMNEDTSLKAHQRYRLGEEEGQTTFDARADKEAETVNSKYVIVKMKAKNVSAFQTDLNKTVGVSIAPILTVMQEGEAGKLVYPQEHSGRQMKDMISNGEQKEEDHSQFILTSHILQRESRE